MWIVRNRIQLQSAILGSLAGAGRGFGGFFISLPVFLLILASAFTRIWWLDTLGDVQ